MQFLCPEKGQNPKSAQIGSVWNFPVLQVDIPRNHGHKPNLKWNQILTMPVRRYPIYGRACQISNVTVKRFQSYRDPYFCSKNGPVPKNHYATPISRILLGAFATVGDPTKSWKFGQNSPSRSLVRAPRNLGPKISTGPKKRFRA